VLCNALYWIEIHAVFIETWQIKFREIKISIGRVCNPKINFYKSIPLPLWDIHGSIPLIDLP